MHPIRGTITITPSGGGVSTPIVQTFSNSTTPQTFTITPTAVGPVTLTPTNSGSLTNPTILSYATQSSPPTTGTATAGPSSVSVSFSASPNNGGSAITLYTATCNPGGATMTGASSPIVVGGLSANGSYSCTVTATNSIEPAWLPQLRTKYRPRHRRHRRRRRHLAWACFRSARRSYISGIGAVRPSLNSTRNRHALACGQTLNKTQTKVCATSHLEFFYHLVTGVAERAKSLIYWIFTREGLGLVLSYS